jgi:hypothetical protein
MPAQTAHAAASSSGDADIDLDGVYPVQLTGLEVSVVRESLQKQRHGLAKHTANQTEDLPEFERLLGRLNATMAVIHKLSDLD